MLRASAIIEKAGIPSVSLVCDGFLGQAAAIRGGLGVPALPSARIVGHVDSQSSTEISDNLRQVTVPQIVRWLTRSPETAAAAGPAQADDASVVAFSGDFGAVQAFFDRRGWTDGLPVVPPTGERIDAFLAETPDPPAREIGVLQPSGMQATVRNVAVNGVMANCEPRHMPVLIAIAEAMADPGYGVQHSGDTTGGEALVIVSGPHAGALGFNCAAGALRDGYRANTTVGRFVRLLLRNVAGIRPGGADKATFGNTWRVALAENHAAVQALNWPSLSQDRGFTADQTTVTVARYTAGGVVGSIYGRTAAAIVPYLADGLVRQMSWEYAFTVGFAAGTIRPLLVLSPLVASTLAKDGCDKAGLQRLLYTHARLPARKLETYIGPWCNLVPGRRSLNDLVADGLAAPAFAGDDPDRPVPIAEKPEDFMIVVGGDPLRSNAFAFGHNGMHGFPTSRVARLRRA